MQIEKDLNNVGLHLLVSLEPNVLLKKLFQNWNQK